MTNRRTESCVLRRAASSWPVIVRLYILERDISRNGGDYSSTGGFAHIVADGREDDTRLQ